MPVRKTRPASGITVVRPRHASATGPATLGLGGRKVALLVETSGGYGRGILKGIARYNRERAQWSTYLRPAGLIDPLPDWVRDWRGDGMIVRAGNTRAVQQLQHLGVPVVNLRLQPGEQQFPYIGIDNNEVIRLALSHLRDRGLRHFAFCGVSRGTNVSLGQRAQLFTELARQEFGRCECYEPSANDGATWDDGQARLAEWVASLPKPVGIMACNDERGFDLLDACRRCGADVPDDVAVIGVDNDQPLCDLSIPPLTSIDVNAETIGYEAASLLDQLMTGRDPARPMQFIPPRGVVTRRSTDIVAGEDADVAKALHFIRDHALGGLQVSNVVAHVGLSRASLQRRMKQVMGRTIHEEIQRVRLARARELLTGSELTIKQIARDSGFSSVQYMTRVFRAATGETPAKYRDQRAE